MIIHEASLIDAAATLLAQAAPLLPDTIIMRQAPSDPNWIERLAEALRALMTIAILALTIAVVPAAWNFRKSYQKISDLLDRVYADINPIAHHASRISDNVDYITTAMRADVQRASATLSEANQRLHEAMREAERRAREFEALLTVVQEEAETTFVSTAAAVRGVRRGVGQLRDDLAESAAVRPRRGGAAGRSLARSVPGTDPSDSRLPDDAPDSLDEDDVGETGGVARSAGVADAAADDTIDDYYDLGDAEDGEIERDAGGAPERPRVRPRRGRGG
jgi:uncharacterized protein YoxC